MKTSFKYFALLFVNVMLCVSQVWGAEGDAAYTLTCSQDGSKTAYDGTHSVNITNNGFAVSWNVNANMGGSGYWRFGGKDIANVERAITQTSSLEGKTINKIVKKVTITHNGVSKNTCTVNSITLKVANNVDFDDAHLIDVRTLNSPSVTSMGSLDLLPNQVSQWPANSFYKIIFNVSNTDKKSNAGFDVQEIVFTEGADRPTCATPTFSPVAGEYNAVQNVTISTTTDGASIYYTTDGSDPTSSSTLFSSAVRIESSCTLKAIAIKDGCNNSGVASAAYTINIPRDVTYHAPNVAGVTVPIKATGVTSIANLPNPGNPTGCAEDYVFVGWIESATYTGAETIYKAEASYTPTRNADLYAVFGTMTGLSETKYEKITSTSQLVAGEKVILVQYSNQVLNNTPSNSSISAPSNLWNNPSDNYKWVLEANSTNWKFKKPNTTSYLSCVSTGSADVGLNKTCADWTIVPIAGHDGYFEIQMASNTAYALEYYSGFKPYSYNASNWSYFAFTIYHQAADVADLTTSPNCAITVTYDKNGATGGDAPEDSKEYEENEEVTVLGQGTMTHSTKFFRGWDTQADGSGTRYQEGDHFNITVATTLYAIWDDAQYRRYLTSCSDVHTFTLDKNLGTEDGSVTFTLNATEYDEFSFTGTRTGYTLQGFNTTAGTNGAGGGTKVLDVDGSIAIVNLSGWVSDGAWKQTDEGKKLYAAWKANKYYVRYNANEGTGSMDNTEFTYDAAAKALRKNTFTRTGYTFQGWATTAEGGVEYTDMQAVRNLTDVNNGIVDLYAVWTINQFNVTYHHAGENRVEPVDYNAHPAGFTPDECSADRVFVGWSETPVATTQATPATVDPTMFSITAAKDFYAVYASRNGGKAGEPTSTTEDFNSYETSSTYNATPIVCGDWTIVNACVSGISDVLGKMGSNAVVIQKAEGSTSSYMQTTNKVDGLKGISCYIATTENSVGYQVLYSTNGTIWNTLAEPGSHNNRRQKQNISGTLTECVDAYVRIVLSSATSTGSQYRMYVDDIELTTQTRSYYLTDYATSCEKAASTTLTYDAQGGTAQTAVTETGWVTLPDGDACERGCYTLTGWLCSGDGETYEPGAKYLFNHDVTMTAQWTVDTEAAVTVTYHTGLEGATTQTVSGVHCGDVLTESEIPTPAACGQNVFVGWAIGEFADAASADGLDKYTVGTAVMGDMDLHAIWKKGKSVFTKYTKDGEPEDGTYIIVDHNTVSATAGKALNSMLGTVDVEIADNKITTDDQYIQWTITKTANGYSVQSVNGYLDITADKTQAMGISSSLIDTWNIAESSTNGVYNMGKTFGASDRRACYNSTKQKWVSYKGRSTGQLYKQSGDGPATFTMNGVCPHIYHATGVDEMTSGTGVSVLSAVSGEITVENGALPVAEKVSGDDGFVITINPVSTGSNGNGSLNYEYSVKFTPTEGNRTYTASYRFYGTGEDPEDTNIVPSDEITFTGYSLPDQFAIAILKDGKYYALPGNATSAGNPSALLIDVVDGKAINVDAAHRYSVYTGTRTSEQRSTVRLKTTAGALWATNAAEQSTIQDYTGSLTASSDAANINTQWTLERAYNENTDAFLGYHLTSDANKSKGLFYKNAESHWGYYGQNYYGGSGYSGEIIFLPLAEEIGDPLDVVDWTSSSVVLNMNGYSSATAASGWTIEAGSNSYNKGNRVADRTLTVVPGAMTANGFVHIVAKGTAGVVESSHMYKVPHIVETTKNISELTTDVNSVIFVRSGKLTINQNTTVEAIYVAPGAELVINQTLTANKVVLRTKAFESPVLTDNGTLNGQVYYTRIVADKSQSYQFALPFDVTLANVKFSNGRTAPLGNAWGLNTYNAAGRAANGKGGNWVGVAPDTETLHKCTGYQILSTSAYYTELYFPVAYTKVAANAQVAVEPHNGTAAQRDPMNANWNFISSPYTSNFTCRWSSPSAAIKLNELYEDNVNFHQYVPDVIKPAAPFYYQAEESGYLQFGNPFTFVASAPATVAARQAVEEEVAEQWIQLFYDDNNGMSDETNIYLHPTKFSIDYEYGFDIEKMSTTGSRPFIYTQLPCGNLAFAAVPDSLAETRIPLAVHAPQNGEMVFSLRENEWLSRLEHVYLVDDTLGQVTDLLTDEYIYPAQAGTQAGRFYLRAVFRTPQIATGVEDTGGGGYTISVEGNRLVVNGLAYGERVCLYDAVGHLMQMTTATGTTLDMNVPATGVYLLQVGKDVKKLILDK